MLDRNLPLAIYMEGATDSGIGKMGHGILRYSPNPIACIIDSEKAGRCSVELTGIDRRVPIVATVSEAQQLGSEVLVLGIAPPGGLIPVELYSVIDEAVDLGMSVVNGLHDLLSPRYSKLNPEQWIWDIRREPSGIGVATGEARFLTNRRVLMIGTDMAIGKMTAGLEIYRACRERGVSTEFIATGQIGITITGQGIPLDAIRVDYAAGAVEHAVLQASKSANVVIVEGQGALTHPGSTANLPLLRGTMPTHLVLCHRAGLNHLQKLTEVALPPLAETIRLYEDLASACGTYRRPVTVGIALNTSHLEDHAAICAIAQVEREVGLPTVDPVRFGPDRLVNAILA